MMATSGGFGARASEGGEGTAASAPGIPKRVGSRTPPSSKSPDEGRRLSFGVSQDGDGQLRLDAPEMEKSGAPPKPRGRSGRAPEQIAGRRVTIEEEHFALDVLTIFNEVSGRRFGSKQAVGKIILRHREHPELTAAEHRWIIEQQFAKPWWKGDPSPNVIYGNGDLFDRALNNVRGSGQAKEKRYTN